MTTRRYVARFSMAAPVVGERTWEASRGEIQRWIEVATSILDALAITGEEGAFDLFVGLGLPKPIKAGSAGAGGTAASGFAPIDHEHPVPTGVPTGLGNANAAGSSLLLPRLDHIHKRDIRVQSEGVDVATRNALNFADSGDIAFVESDEAGPDRVTVRANLTASAQMRPAHPQPHTHLVDEILGETTQFVLAGQIFGRR